MPSITNLLYAGAGGLIVAGGMSVYNKVSTVLQNLESKKGFDEVGIAFKEDAQAIERHLNESIEILVSDLDLIATLKDEEGNVVKIGETVSKAIQEHCLPEVIDHQINGESVVKLRKTWLNPKMDFRGDMAQGIDAVNEARQVYCDNRENLKNDLFFKVRQAMTDARVINKPYILVNIVSNIYSLLLDIAFSQMNQPGVEASIILEAIQEAFDNFMKNVLTSEAMERTSWFLNSLEEDEDKKTNRQKAFEALRDSANGLMSKMIKSQQNVTLQKIYQGIKKDIYETSNLQSEFFLRMIDAGARKTPEGKIAFNPRLLEKGILKKGNEIESKSIRDCVEKSNSYINFSINQEDIGKDSSAFGRLLKEYPDITQMSSYDPGDVTDDWGHLKFKDRDNRRVDISEKREILKAYHNYVTANAVAYALTTDIQKQIEAYGHVGMANTKELDFWYAVVEGIIEYGRAEYTKLLDNDYVQTVIEGANNQFSLETLRKKQGQEALPLAAGYKEKDYATCYHHQALTGNPMRLPQTVSRTVLSQVQIMAEKRGGAQTNTIKHAKQYIQVATRGERSFTVNLNNEERLFDLALLLANNPEMKDSVERTIEGYWDKDAADQQIKDLNSLSTKLEGNIAVIQTALLDAEPMSVLPLFREESDKKTFRLINEKDEIVRFSTDMLEEWEAIQLASAILGVQSILSQLNKMGVVKLSSGEEGFTTLDLRGLSAYSSMIEVRSLLEKLSESYKQIHQLNLPKEAVSYNQARINASIEQISALISHVEAHKLVALQESSDQKAILVADLKKAERRIETLERRVKGLSRHNETTLELNRTLQEELEALKQNILNQEVNFEELNGHNQLLLAKIELRTKEEVEHLHGLYEEISNINEKLQNVSSQLAQMIDETSPLHAMKERYDLVSQSLSALGEGVLERVSSLEVDNEELKQKIVVIQEGFADQKARFEANGKMIKQVAVMIDKMVEREALRHSSAALLDKNVNIVIQSENNHEMQGLNAQRIRGILLGFNSNKIQEEKRGLLENQIDVQLNRLTDIDNERNRLIGEIRALNETLLEMSENNPSEELKSTNPFDEDWVEDKEHQMQQALNRCDAEIKALKSQTGACKKIEEKSKELALLSGRYLDLSNSVSLMESEYSSQVTLCVKQSQSLELRKREIKEKFNHELEEIRNIRVRPGLFSYRPTKEKFLVKMVKELLRFELDVHARFRENDDRLVSFIEEQKENFKAEVARKREAQLHRGSRECTLPALLCSMIDDRFADLLKGIRESEAHEYQEPTLVQCREDINNAEGFHVTFIDKLLKGEYTYHGHPIELAYNEKKETYGIFYKKKSAFINASELGKFSYAHDADDSLAMSMR